MMNALPRILAATFCFLTVALAAVPSHAQRVPRAGFVGVDGTRMTLNGGDFYFAGANSYSLLYSERDAEEEFRVAKSLGLNAIRMWGFWNGDDPQPVLDAQGRVIQEPVPGTDVWGRHVLQPSPGIYNEEGFLKFDYAIYLANAHGMKLIIPLLNEWSEFGGLDQLLRWAGVEFPPLPEGHYASETVVKDMRGLFFTNERAQQIYLDYVTYVLNRVNTYTGVAYKDDPAIMIWEVMNEPRFGPWLGDQSAELVRNFLERGAKHIKSIDQNHLVATGEEGFFFLEETATGRTSYPWYAATGEGVSFVMNSSIPEIDVLTIHGWPFQWSLIGEYPDLSTFMPEWIAEHARVAEELGKPLYLGEFGFQILRRPGTGSDVPDRDRIYEKTFEAAMEHDLAGTLYWNITGSHNPDEAVYKGPLERFSLQQGVFNDEVVPHDLDFRFDVYCPEDVTTCSLIENYARHTVARVENPDPPFERSCLAPWESCGGECVLTASHPLHCGACGVVCADAEVCEAGKCTAVNAMNGASGDEFETVGCAMGARPSTGTHGSPWPWIALAGFIAERLLRRRRRITGS